VAGNGAAIPVQITENYPMRQRLTLLDLVEKHQLLDDAIREDRKHFVSDWNGTHPFVSEFLGPEILTRAVVTPDQARYLYFDEELDVLDAVRKLHETREGLSLSRENVLAGPGSSSLLTALCLWILHQGYREVYYIPPLYYTLHYFLRMLTVRPRPVTGKHAFEIGAALNLPAKKALLLLCDPIWFAGRRVPPQMMETIANWQRDTGSSVIIDGSFQFMQWENGGMECSSILDPELTFRVISPTKSLAIPCFRFAYLLHPAWSHRELLFLYENTVGGATVGDVAFARRSLQVLRSDESNHRFTNYLKDNFELLIAKDVIHTRIVPDCGYFVFAVPRRELPRQIVMDQEYFELEGYPDHVRINLMLARNLYSEEFKETDSNL
jgi:aspartate/methionine/tyrosine aminotransferase